MCTLLSICTTCIILLCAATTLAVKPLRVDVKASREKRNAVDVEIVTPVRMREDLSQAATTHFRARRSVVSEEDSSKEFSNPTYKIHAFGEDLLVRLVPDDILVAPTFTTTYTWKNASSPRTLDQPSQPQLRKCFYKGTVIGKPGSQAVMSICDSLTGSITTGDYQYTIRPVDTTSAEEIKPHTIERRSLTTNQHRHGAQCGVKDPRHVRRYQETFLHSPMEEVVDKVVNQVKRSVAKSPEQNVIDFENSMGEEKSRRKRDVFESRQHYIETLVVADATMAREHGDDLEHYILSIMMVANRVFSHPSLGSAIALSVVRIMVIEDEREGPDVSTNAAATLRQFCTWQKRHNTPDDSHPDHADLSILLTRKNLCGDSCDTLGMAEVGTMCSGLHSCAIVEDDGLSAAYTVAHEVGHVLNMMHDDNGLCQANFVIDPKTHVMSATMDRVDRDQPWSLCSRQAVLDYLQEGRGDCLLDRPSQPKVYPRELPGQMYDVNAQCEMAFGDGAVACPYMNECGRLWCQLPSGTRTNKCHTRNYPRADGTPCSPGRHCLQGQCLPKSAPMHPIDGQWGSWSSYGSCSRTCGGGIQMSSRQCNNPSPQHGGQYCMGDRLRFNSCNNRKCPRVNGKEPGDFRSQQCASYNGQHIPLLGPRNNYSWIPKYVDVHQRDRCKLICQSVQTGAYITLADRVVDGTRCGPDTADVCVHGQCMPAGCDGVLNSKAKFNKCGVCNGDKSTCKRVRGKYNRRSPGYNDVITLPVGAANIKITQKGYRKNIYDGNYLALQNSRGEYILNGALTLITIAKDIEVNGSVIQYSGVSKVTERIHTTMPLKEPIKLQVLSLGIRGSDIAPPSIRYRYYISVPRRAAARRTAVKPTVLQRSPVSRKAATTKASRKHQPRWAAGRWKKCRSQGKQQCGSGWKTRIVSCKIGKRVATGCNPDIKPYDTLPCFIKACPTTPPRPTPPRRRFPTHDSRHPTIVNRYNYAFWNAGSWGPCSASCGLGTKMRLVKCQMKSGRLVANSKCDAGRRPSEYHGCKLRECR